MDITNTCGISNIPGGKQNSLHMVQNRRVMKELLTELQVNNKILRVTIARRLLLLRLIGLVSNQYSRSQWELNYDRGAVQLDLQSWKVTATAQLIQARKKLTVPLLPHCLPPMSLFQPIPSESGNEKEAQLECGRE